MAQNNATIDMASSYAEFLEVQSDHEAVVDEYGPQSSEAVESAQMLIAIERKCADEVGIDIGQKFGF